MADVNVRIGAKDETKKATSSVQKGFSGIGSEATDAGKKAQAGLEGTNQSATSLTGGLSKVKLGIAAVGIAAVAGFKSVIGGAFESAREIKQLQISSGLSATALQELREVGRSTGAGIDDIADASRELTLRLTEAARLQSGPAVDALNLLGVSTEQLAGLSADERFSLIRDRLSETTDEADRLFIAEELLGGSSERLAGLIGLSADEMDRQAQAARDSGLSCSPSRSTRPTRRERRGPARRLRSPG